MTSKSPKRRRRSLALQTRTNAPFVVHLASDPAVEDINTKKALKAYTKGQGAIVVDDDCARFTIRVLSFKENQEIIEEVSNAHANTFSEQMARHSAKEQEANEQDGAEAEAGDTITGDDVPHLFDNIRMMDDGHKRRIEVGLLKIEIPAVDDEGAPVFDAQGVREMVEIKGTDEGFMDLFDPDSEVGLGDPAECAAIMRELGGIIEKASTLGPKAESHFKRLYGSPTQGEEAPPPSPGAATDAPLEPGSGAVVVEAPFSEG